MQNHKKGDEVEVFGRIYHVIHPKEPNRVRYIGKTTGTVKRREQGHWSDTSRPRLNSRFQNWLIKYRSDRGLIEFREVAVAYSEDELNDLEIRHILDHRNLGQADLNITSGGDGGLGLKWSEESKEKLSKTLGGPGAWKAKYTWDEVNEIRRLYLAGYTRRELVSLYPQTAKSTMQKILRNDTWKDPNYTPPDRAEQIRRRDFIANARLTPEKREELRIRSTQECKQYKQWADEYGISVNAARALLENRTFPDPSFDPKTVLRPYAPRSDKGVKRSQADKLE